MSDQYHDPDYRLKAADQLNEVDLLKIRLLNRNVDCLESEVLAAKLRLQLAVRELQDFSIVTWDRYGVDPEELDGNTGRITRKPVPQDQDAETETQGA